MHKNNLMQIVSRILPPELCSEIETGAMADSEIAYNLAVLIADCEALNDAASSMTQRRLSKQLTALGGLMMILLDECSLGSAGANEKNL
jgi:hypothetical protein